MEKVKILKGFSYLESLALASCKTLRFSFILLANFLACFLLLVYPLGYDIMLIYHPNSPFTGHFFVVKVGIEPTGILLLASTILPHDYINTLIYPAYKCCGCPYY